MNQRVAGLSKRLCLVLAVLILPVVAPAEPQKGREKEKDNGSPEIGLLLLAHGGEAKWNAEVERVAATVNRTIPTEVAFGMATRRNIQGAVDRLAARSVRRIVAVPLFVSSHSSVITSTEYLLGLRKQAPPELASFARMDHGHGHHDHAAAHASHSSHSIEKGEPSLEGITPVRSSLPIRMAAALDRHPLVADILLTRAAAISQNASREVLVVVAHGPVSDKENAKWLADMGALVDRMRAAGEFQRIEYLTVRDDAPEPIRSQAAAELRRVVERSMAAGHRVLLVPLLISYGGIEKGIKKRLEGLSYTMPDQALLPDERLATWVLESAQGISEHH